MVFRFHEGSIPLLVSFSHSSTFLPDELAAAMTEHGKAVPDTDWFLPRLYNFLDDLGPSIIEARFSRYVIDPNRPIDGSNLYPGQPTPELCPVQTFAGDPIWQEGHEPDRFEMGRRIREYWTPYHDRIAEELARLRHRFGRVVLLDAHSIRSRVPRLFEGLLPDINIGTARGESCDAGLQQAIEAVLKKASGFTWVINGRFVGGHITRHYGQPGRNVHAVQLELSQRRYLDEESGKWDESAATPTRTLLRRIVEAVIHWAGGKCE